MMKLDSFPDKMTYTASFRGISQVLIMAMPRQWDLVNTHSWEYLGGIQKIFLDLEHFWDFNEHFVVAEESQLRKTFQFWLHI